MSRPVIGVTMTVRAGSFCLAEAYLQALRQAGGLPLLLPVLDEEERKALPAFLDGVLFSGGGDPAPQLYGEEPQRALGQVEAERDRFELWLAGACRERGLPALGICRGAQIMNLARGGTLYQDIYEPPRTKLQHMQRAPGEHACHSVWLTGALLRRLAAADQAMVNSFHHQSVARLGAGLLLAATAADGLTEALEAAEGESFYLGVQWHPERMPEDGFSRAIFRAFVEACH